MDIGSSRVPVQGIPHRVLGAEMAQNVLDADLVTCPKNSLACPHFVLPEHFRHPVPVFVPG